MSRKFFALILIMSGYFMANATDADTVPGDSAVMLRDVVVRDHNRRQIISTRHLDGSELERLSTHSVADAMRYFAGVQVKDYGGVGGIKTVNIRSMGSEHTGVYYDGIPLGNAQNGQIDLGKYSLDNIDEVSLYNGNKSNMLQGARDFGQAGAVYLRTRRPRRNGDERYHLRAAVRAGSFGLIAPEATVEWFVNDNVSISATGAYTYANGRYKFRYRRLNLDNTAAYDTTATRHNGDVEAWRGEVAAFGHTLRGTWLAKFWVYDSDRGVPGAIVNNVWRNGERQHDRNMLVHAGGEWLISPLYHLKVAAKYANDYMHYLRDDPKELYVNNTYRQQEIYCSTANLFTINDKWSTTLSVDMQYNTMTASLRNFANPHRVTAMEAAAVSFDTERFAAQASLLTTTIFDRTDASPGSHRRTSMMTRLQPAAFFSVTPLADAPRWHVTGFTKKSMRMPTFNDLYYTDIGNKNLKPEDTWQFDIGSNYTINPSYNLLKSIALRVDGYHNRVNNKIVAYPAGQQFRWTMLNLGRVKIWGVDAAADISLQINKVSGGLRLTYTYQDARDVTDRSDSYYGDQIPYIPHHAFTVAANADWHDWQFNYSCIYTGRRYNAQENILANLEQPWYTHDLSLYKNLTLNAVRLRVGLEINNIFGQDYEVIHNYPMPGRNYKAIIKIEI